MEGEDSFSKLHHAGKYKVFTFIAQPADIQDSLRISLRFLFL